MLLQSPLLARTRLIAASAHGGQSVVSAGALSASALPPDAVVTDLGEHQLGPLDSPEPLRQVLPRALASRTFPPLRTLSARKTNIVADRSSFVGRKRELEELESLLLTPAGRLVILTGFGGIGKTRLARQAALLVLPVFEGGCWFADLMEARTPAQASEAVATAMGIPIQGGDDPARAVADALEFRAPFLLVLDGFEGIVDCAAATLGLWLRKARQGRFLVTSQSLPGLSGERELPLGPLPCPAPAASAAELMQSDAARLLLDRAASSRGNFTPSEADARILARICADLEGIPLALELAAARLAAANPKELLGNLARVASDPQAAAGPAAGRSLQDTLTWSYGLLNDWQRSALAQTCTFRGGFFLEAAEEVIDLTAFPDAPLAMDAVQALRDRSLLRTADTHLGTRFSLFRTIREYGEARWRESAPEPERAALEFRHASTLAHLLESANRRLDGESPREELARIELERENALEAVTRMRSRGDPGAEELAGRIALAVEPTLRLRSHMAERLAVLRRVWNPDSSTGRMEEVGFQLVDALLNLGDRAARAEARQVAWRCSAAAENSGSDLRRARAGIMRARVLAAESSIAEAVRTVDEACGLLPADVPAAARQEVLTAATQVDTLASRYAPALERLHQALKEALASGMRLRAAVIRFNIAAVGYHTNETTDWLDLNDQALHEFRRFGLPMLVAKCQGNRGLMMLQMKRPGDAATEILAAVQAHRDAGLKRGMLLHMNNYGLALRDSGRPEEALAVYREAEALALEMDDMTHATRIIGNIGAAYFTMGRLEEALEHALRAAAILKKGDPTESLALNQGNAGLCLLRMRRIGEAEVLIAEARETWDRLRLGSTRPVWNVLSDLALIQAESGQAGKARETARDAIRRATGSGWLAHASPDDRERMEKLRALA